MQQIKYSKISVNKRKMFTKLRRKEIQEVDICAVFMCKGKKKLGIIRITTSNFLLNKKFHTII